MRLHVRSRAATSSSRRWGAVAVCLLAVGAVGCGSDDDGADPSDSDSADADSSADAGGTDADGSTDPASTQTTLPDSEADTGSTDITIVSVSDGFQPNSLTVAVGAQVVWTNLDAIAHTSTAEDGAWDSAELGVSEAFSFVADTPGTYAYFCTIHPSMTGELIVE